jgi:hypothetical protein
MVVPGVRLANVLPGTNDTPAQRQRKAYRCDSRVWPAPPHAVQVAVHMLPLIGYLFH